MPGVVILTDSAASPSADHPDDALSLEELAGHGAAGGTATTSGPSRQALADAMEGAVDDGASRAAAEAPPVPA